MANADEARGAIAKFNGYSLGGPGLTANEAKPREEGGGGGRGGYGGGIVTNLDPLIHPCFGLIDKNALR